MERDRSTSPLPGFRAMAIGGLVAGTLDMLDAILFSYGLRGIAPIRVLQSVASGMLGRSAYEGGLATAALGLTLHFFIALVVAAVYVSASRQVAWLRQHAVPFGIAYGVAVYFFMQQIVLPLSAFRAGAFAWPSFVNGVLIHAFGVGLPLALAARRFVGKQSAASRKV